MRSEISRAAWRIAGLAVCVGTLAACSNSNGGGHGTAGTGAAAGSDATSDSGSGGAPTGGTSGTSTGGMVSAVQGGSGGTSQDASGGSSSTGGSGSPSSAGGAGNPTGQPVCVEGTPNAAVDGVGGIFEAQDPNARMQYTPTSKSVSYAADAADGSHLDVGLFTGGVPAAGQTVTTTKDGDFLVTTIGKNGNVEGACEAKAGAKVTIGSNFKVGASTGNNQTASGDMKWTDVVCDANSNDATKTSGCVVGK